MRTSAELKVIAKDSLRGNYGKAIGAMLVYGVMSGIPFCAPPMQVGYYRFNNKLVRKQDAQVGDVFEGFSVFGKSWWLTIIMTFFLSLWSMLLIIPGIIKSFAYALAPYVLSDNPQMTAREALRASIRMMDGKKGKLFYLGLSFIGWAFVGALTAGIAYLWILPYMQATYAAFYNEVLLVSNSQHN